VLFAQKVMVRSLATPDLPTVCVPYPTAGFGGKVIERCSVLTLCRLARAPLGAVDTERM